MLEGEERRKANRRREAKVVKFSLETRKSGKGCHGITGNISETGLLLYTIHNVQKGEGLVMEYAGPPDCVKGKVRWAKKVGNIFQLGIECMRYGPFYV